MSDMSYELLAIRRRRLEYLEKQQATKGIDAEFHIADEIRQIHIEIDRLLHYSHIYRLQRTIREEERPKPMQGLIVLVSPEDVRPDARFLKQAAYDAIDYHRTALKACWLIATSGDKSSLEAAQWLEKDCTNKSIPVQLWQVQDPSNVKETYDIVRMIDTNDLAHHHLQPANVIIDITGATKPMSIGAFLARQHVGPVQYMARQQGQHSSVPVVIHASGNPKEQQ